MKIICCDKLCNKYGFIYANKIIVRIFVLIMYTMSVYITAQRGAIFVTFVL